jgi:undecaprenyl-diphosphatase
MLEKIVALDKDLFVFLNGLGSETYDGLWLLITKQINWIPFFLLLAYLLIKNLGWKAFGFVMLFIALLLLVGNETVEFCKVVFERLRPCNEPELKNSIRIVHQSDSFSFFSGHATNSMATMTFVFLILRKYSKYAFLVFLYPLIFAYSRIYLGVHYPTDILTGYTVGATMGGLFYKGYQYFIKRKSS